MFLQFMCQTYREVGTESHVSQMRSTGCKLLLMISFYLMKGYFMLQSTTKTAVRYFLFSMTIILFTVCGSGGISSDSFNTALSLSGQRAMQIIESYADNNNSITPKLGDYTALGISGVSVSNLEKVNEHIRGIKHSQADTIEEIQSIVDIYRVDVVSPMIILNGNTNLSLYVGDTYIEKGAIAKDDVDDMVSVVISGKVNTAATGTYVVTYTAKDKSGNRSQTIRRVVVKEKPLPDTSPPVITLNGEMNMVITLGEAYKELGASAVDAVDGSVSVSVSAEVNSGSKDKYALTYTLTYSAVDHAGNKATKTRVVRVIDATAPVITLDEEKSMMTLAVGDR